MKTTFSLIAFTVLITACGNKNKTTNDPMESLQGRYEVTALEGTTLEEGIDIWLNFDLEESRVNGKAACNTFFGSFTQEGESIQMGQMGSTMMACPDPLMEYERRFLDLIGAVTTVGGNGDELLLKNEEEKVLITATKSTEEE